MPCDILDHKVGNTQIEPSTTACNLGVIFGSCLNLESPINSVCRSAYFHLRTIRSVRNMLTDKECSQLIMLWLQFVLIIVTFCYMVCLVKALTDYK